MSEKHFLDLRGLGRVINKIISKIPTKTSDLINDKYFQTGAEVRSYVNAQSFGKVKNVNTGVGLTGGPITETGTIKANLVSETRLGSASEVVSDSDAKVYPVALDSQGKLSVAVPDTVVGAATESPTAIGNESVVGTSRKYAREDHTHNIDVTTGDANGQIKIAGQNVDVKGLGSIAYKDELVESDIPDLSSTYVKQGSDNDSHVEVTLDTTRSAKAYLLATTTPPIKTPTNVVAKADGSVYLDTKPGALSVGQRTSGNVGTSSFTNGNSLLATGNYSHAEGNWSEARGSFSHAEGNASVARGQHSHAEGSVTETTGVASHAEGNATKASGMYSHAEGEYTEARGEGQHVSGKYNIVDENNTYAEIVGNGDNSTRSNARTLDWNGNATYSGRVTVGIGPIGNMDLTTKQYVDDAIDNIIIDTPTDARTVNGHTVESDVPANAVFTDTTYTDATTSSAGLMSSADKTKLNLIEDNAQENVIESVSVNGETVEVIDKNVDISVPKIDDIFNERTISGNPIYINDAVNAPATNVIVGIEATQDLNGYDHPWVGGAGNNLLPKIICTPRTQNGITFTPNDDGSVHVSGTATGETLSKVERVWETTDETDLTWLEPGTYTVNAFGGRIWVMFTNEAKEQNPIASFNVQNGGSHSVTLTEKLAIYIRADILASDGALDTDVKASVVSGSTGLTTWEPYENICPIVGVSTVKVTRTGKNLGNFVNGLSSDPTTGLPTATNVKRCSTVTPIKIDPTKTYVASGVGNSCFIYAVLNNDTLVRRIITYTTGGTVLDTSGGTDLYVTCFNNPESTNATVEDNLPMVTIQSDDDTYESYQEQEVEVELNDETFGGTLDVTNGKLTLTHYVYNIPAISSIASSTGGTKKYVSFPSVGSYLIDKSVPAISDRMTWVEYANRGEAYHFYYASSNNAVFVTFVPKDATVDSINTDLVGGQIVYQLETPIEYALTPQQIEMLSGENIIWSNANGNIDVTYKVRPMDESVLDSYITKDSFDDAGIKDRTYTTILNETLTTVVTEGWNNPHATAATTYNFDKQYKYRVTFNGTEYILSCKLWWFTTNNDGFKVYEYLGNLGLYTSTTGVTHDIDNAPFIIINDLNSNLGIDILTEEAGTYTVKIERITYTKDLIPKSLIYNDDYYPIEHVNNGTSTFDSISIGVNTIINKRGSIAIGFCNTINNQFGTAIGTHNTVSQDYAYAEGYHNTSSGSDSHSEGAYTTASGHQSHSEGAFTKASNNGSHSEGVYTTASGQISHAEGAYTTASGMESHAEGERTTASGSVSHAEGFSTIADGDLSHAEGYSTIANGNFQHASGKFNIADDDSIYAEIVGNGSDDNNRSNARTLDWDGNATYAGKVTVGAGPTNNMDLTTKQYVDGIVATAPYFGVCSDSGVTRSVTVNGGFVLAEGVMINVFFENQSTSQTTLNVNNTGAYPIYIYGTQAVSGAFAWGWRAGQLVELVFHDSKWYVQNQYFSNAGTGGSGLMTTAHAAKLDSLDPNSTAPISLWNEDLNDIHPTSTTWYYSGGGNHCTNKPYENADSFGMVCFRTATGYIVQTFWPTGWAYYFLRTWNGTSWTNWVSIGKEASSSENGLMSVTDKNNLDGIVGTQLTNEDLNDIHPGHFAVYWADSNNTCTHKPTAISVYAFALVCLKTTSAYQLQVLFHPTSNRQWRRYWTGSSWSGWSEITYSWNAASGWAGLMSAADKIKLDGLKASTINVTDTYGVAGTAGATVTIQDLMDAIASKV